MDPHAKRDADERRLTGLKAGVVGLAVAGIGVFAGLAAAGTYDSPVATGVAAQDVVTPAGSASDAARIAEDDSFFDDQRQDDALGGYESPGGGTDADGAYGQEPGGHRDGDHHGRRGHHAPPGGDERYGGSGYADGGSGAGVQSSPGMQGGGGYGGPPAQGSTGAS